MGLPLLILGYGSIGRRYASILDELGLPYRIFDPGVSVPDSNQFVKKLENLTDYQAALICTPNHLHVEQALHCANAGLHLFIEKPLTVDFPASLKDLKKAVLERKLLAMVSCNFRFETGMRTLKEFLRAGKLGRVYSVLGEFGQYLPTWRPQTDYRKSYSARAELGGGVIFDRIHEVDYLMHLFGRPRTLSARFGKLSSLQIEAEDTADILFEFEGPIHANLHLDYLQAGYCCRLKVIGEKGTTEWQYNPSRLELRLHGVEATEVLYENPKPDPNQMYKAQLQHFLGCLESRTQPVNSIEEAEETARVCLKAKKL